MSSRSNSSAIYQWNGLQWMKTTPAAPDPRHFKRKWLADTIRLAADKCLKLDPEIPSRKKDEFSCVAIEEAISRRCMAANRWAERSLLSNLMHEATKSLGIRASMYGNAFPRPRGWRARDWELERQQIRFAWLHFFADLVEENGMRWLVNDPVLTPYID